MKTNLTEMLKLVVNSSASLSYRITKRDLSHKEVIESLADAVAINLVVLTEFYKVEDDKLAKVLEEKATALLIAAGIKLGEEEEKNG